MKNDPFVLDSLMKVTDLIIKLQRRVKRIEETLKVNGIRHPDEE